MLQGKPEVLIYPPPISYRASERRLTILEPFYRASRTLHRFIGDLTEIFLNLRNPRNKSFLELNLEQAHIIEELSALLPTLHPFLPPSPLAIRADPITTPHTILDNYSTAPVGRYVPPTTSMPGYVEYTPTSTTGSRTSILQPQHLSLSTRQATLPPVFPSIRSRVRRTDEERLEMETVRVKVEDQLDRLEQEAGIWTRHQDERKTGGETRRGTTPAREIKWTAPMGVRRP